jgi:hypothetical protein
MISNRLGSVMLFFVRSDSISRISNRTGNVMLFSQVKFHKYDL